MDFIDAATIPQTKPGGGVDGADLGVNFVSADGAWLVCSSDKRVSEWVIWQRAVRGDRRTVVGGYVRRVPWMRFTGPTGREQAQFIAGVLDDLPLHASLEVFRVAVADALRDAKTRLVYRTIAHVVEVAKAMRRDVEAREEAMVRD